MFETYPVHACFLLCYTNPGLQIFFKMFVLCISAVKFPLRKGTRFWALFCSWDDNSHYLYKGACFLGNCLPSPHKMKRLPPPKVASLEAVGDHWISWLYQALVIPFHVNRCLTSNPAYCLRKAPLLTYLWLSFTPQGHELTIPRGLACRKIFELRDLERYQLEVWMWQRLARLESTAPQQLSQVTAP